jgi:hypothetical protein
VDIRGPTPTVAQERQARPVVGRCNRGTRKAGGGGLDEEKWCVGHYGPAQNEQYQFTFNFNCSNKFEFAIVQNLSSPAHKISNKIWICRELNKEQLS